MDVQENNAAYFSNESDYALLMIVMMTKMLFYSDFIAVSHYEATTRLSPSLLSHVISTAQDNVTMMVMMMKR